MATLWVPKRALCGEESAAELWMALIGRLERDWDSVSVCLVMVTTLARLRLGYPAVCDADRFVGRLEVMARMTREDDEIERVVPAVYLDLLANDEEGVRMQLPLLQTVADLLVEEKYKEWLWPSMVRGLATVVERYGKQHDLWVVAGRVFAHFLAQKEAKREARGMTSADVGSMAKALALCVEARGAIMDAIKERYAEEPEKLGRISGAMAVP